MHSLDYTADCLQKEEKREKRENAGRNVQTGSISISIRRALRETKITSVCHHSQVNSCGPLIILVHNAPSTDRRPSVRGSVRYRWKREEEKEGEVINLEEKREMEREGRVPSCLSSTTAAMRDEEEEEEEKEEEEEGHCHS